MRVGTPQRVPIDLSDCTPVRADLRLQVLSRRKIHLCQSFEDLLTVPIVDGAVVKNHDHERQAENGFRAQIGEVRDSVHLDFDRNRDQLFHLFCGPARPLRDDGHIVVGDIGIGFHGQGVERDSAPADRENCGSHDHKLVVKRKVYERTNHFLFLAGSNRLPHGRGSVAPLIGR